MGKKPAVHTAVSGKCWQLCCKTGSFLTFSSLPCLAPCSHSPRGLCLLWKKQRVGWSSTRRLQRADSTARGSCTGSSATALLSRIELAAEPTELGKRAKPNSYTGIFHLGCYLPHRLIFIFSKLYCALLFILKSNQSTSISMHLLAIPRFYKSLLVKKKKKGLHFFGLVFWVLSVTHRSHEFSLLCFFTFKSCTKADYKLQKHLCTDVTHH